MNKHSGFGGLCAEPYCDEFQFVVERHLVDPDKDKKFGFQLYRSLSRVDEEFTADDGGVRLR